MLTMAKLFVNLVMGIKKRRKMANDIRVQVEEKVKTKDYLPGQREKEILTDSLRKIKEERRCPFCGRELVVK